MVRLAVLASGSGTNLQAIIDAASAPEWPAQVAVVLSDKPRCGALDRAERAGIPTEVVTWEEHGGDRSAFTVAITERLEKHEVDLVALAGFMRILTGEILEGFPSAVLNTHPALLPSFRGAHGVRDAIEYGVKVSGVTIHLVDEKVDHGPIVAQAAVPVLPDDDEESLQERIKQVEHTLFPEAIADYARGCFRVEGRRVLRIRSDEEPGEGRGGGDHEG